jgi:plasmid stabilization system protein ParE
VKHESLRELIVENYRVIYHPWNETIEIIAVPHSRQDLTTKFGQREQ